MPDVGTELRLFGQALRFLTRLPVPGHTAHDDASAASAVRYFPAVGLTVGLLAGVVFVLGLWFGLPPLAAAGLALTAQMLLTGALHEDGLADCADGLGGGATRARALEIMRDSRIGSYGALALGLSLILRMAALAALGPLPGLAALVIANALARAAIVMALVSMPYARPEGLALGASRARGRVAVGVSLGTGLLAALALGQGAGLLAAGAGALVWTVTRWRLMRRLGGYTGDGLGAIEQLVEIAALLVMASAWG